MFKKRILFWVIFLKIQIVFTRLFKKKKRNLISLFECNN